MNQKASPASNSGAYRTTRSNYRRLDFKQVKEAAKGHWFHILTAHGIPANLLRRKHGPCPICGGKDRFRFDDKNSNGTFFCNSCGAGDGFTLLSLHKDIGPSESLHLVADYFGWQGNSIVNQPVVSSYQSKSNGANHQNVLQQIWSHAKPVVFGDPVHQYLVKTRQLNLAPVPSALRYHESIDYFGNEGFIGAFPAMVALVSSANGDMVCLHRTYLTTDGQKAPVDKPKKLMKPTFEGATKGGAIRLFEPTEVLGIAEGIETALACHIDTGLPVWSAISAGGLSSVEIPTTVRQVVIFSDHDSNGVGKKAALKLATRLLDEGREVKVLIPPNQDSDWADFVVSGGNASNV